MPSEEKLLAAIDDASSQAFGGDTEGGELSRQRALALDAFAGKNIEPAPEGRSQVVDWTVFETIQWMLPSFMRIFASGDNIVEFEPTGPEDEEAAEQETEVLNHIVTQKNNWFMICLQWFQDALLTKNAYCMAFIEDRRQVEKESYQDQSLEQAALLLDDESVEVVSQTQKIDETTEEPQINPETGQPEIDPFTGQPVLGPAVTFDLDIRRTKTQKRLQFEVLPPEQCVVGGDTPNFGVKDANYFEFWQRTTISDLRKDGFDVEDDIGDDHRFESDEHQSRDELLRVDQIVDRPSDPAMRQVKVRHIWIRHDYDEDGIAELQYVVLVGREVLRRDEVNRIPVASIVPFVNTHRHIGMSVADLVFDIQRIKTVLLRQGLDSLYLSVNPRHQVSRQVNLDDLLVAQPGGAVRVDGLPGEGHILPLATEFVFPEAQEGLKHMDTVTEARVGVNRMFQGIDESNINDHNRVGQLSTMAAQRVEQIARIFGNGVEDLFNIAHELLIKSGHKMESIRLRGQWVNIDPTQWKTGRDMRVVAPYAAGNKDALLQRLNVIRGIHSEAAAAGHPMVQPDDSYRLALEMAKAADVPGDRFFTDPATIPPPQPQPDPTLIALEIESQRVANQDEDSKRDADVDLRKAELEAALDKYRADLNAEVTLLVQKLKAGEQVNLEAVKAELRDSPVRLANESIEATGRNLREGLTSELREAIASINEQVRQLEELVTAPRKLIKDDSGNIVGAEVNGRVISVVES